MAEKKYNLVLTGRTLPGREHAAVAAALAKLMRLTEARATELLAGRETIIKRGVNEADLRPYLGALEQAGGEARAEEIIAAAAVPPPAQETIKCPACGAEQPKRNLCRECGVDMRRMLAAKVEEQKAPAPPAPSAAARPFPGPESVLDRPFYRRSLFVEILFFLFLNLIWSYFTMTDARRGTKMRVVGGVFFVVGALLVGLRVLVFTGVISDGTEEVAVLDAAEYTFKVGGEVERYAVANQRFPNRTASVELPEPRPQAVKAVLIGPEGRVEVRLSETLRHSADGAFVLTPRVEGGQLHWKCEYENVKLDRATVAIFNRCD